MRCAGQWRLRAALLGLVGLATGCGSLFGPFTTRRPPEDAIRVAVGRLEASKVTVNPATIRPRSLKTDWHCLRERDMRQGGIDWDRTWATIADGPLPFETVGAANAAPDPGERCPLLFRVHLEAQPVGDGSRIHAEAEWWRAVAGECSPEGDPLQGLTRCRWRYQATHRKHPATRRVYHTLRDL